MSPYTPRAMLKDASVAAWSLLLEEKHIFLSDLWSLFLFFLFPDQLRTRSSLWVQFMRSSLPPSLIYILIKASTVDSENRECLFSFFLFLWDAIFVSLPPTSVSHLHLCLSLSSPQRTATSINALSLFAEGLLVLKMEIKI